MLSGVMPGSGKLEIWNPGVITHQDILIATRLTLLAREAADHNRLVENKYKR